MIHYVRFTTPPVQDFSRPQDFERFRPLHTTAHCTTAGRRAEPFLISMTSTNQ